MQLNSFNGFVCSVNSPIALHLFGRDSILHMHFNSAITFFMQSPGGAVISKFCSSLLLKSRGEVLCVLRILISMCQAVDLPTSHCPIFTEIEGLVQIKVIIASHDFGPDYTLHQPKLHGSPSKYTLKILPFRIFEQLALTLIRVCSNFFKLEGRQSRRHGGLWWA